ncbi:MAG: tryptophan synthase subunit alpha [Phycisphaerales bacterium]
MNRRIDQIFADLRANRQKALMPFVCGGFPSPGVLTRLLPALQASGASVVEIGFPFSDPIADGPVIAAAMSRAIAGGTTAATIFKEVESVRAQLSIGLVAMVSVSIVNRLGGPKGFASRAAAAGFDGLIVPDVPLEESGELQAAAAEAGLAYSLLIAPTTVPARAAEIMAACSGFCYLLARSGITGEQSGTPEIAGRVAKLRQVGPLPIACGFGVSTPQQVNAVVRHADAAIVGSALVRRMSEAAAAGRDPVDEAAAMVRALCAGLVTDETPRGSGEVAG